MKFKNIPQVYFLFEYDIGLKKYVKDCLIICVDLNSYEGSGTPKKSKLMAMRDTIIFLIQNSTTLSWNL